MYTLLNMLKFGLSSLDNSKKFVSSSPKLEDAHRLDFMSGIFFRVFENLISDENDPARFKLEIIVNKGSTLDPAKVKEIENHCINIHLENSFTKTLTLDDVDSFFNVLMDMWDPNSSPSSEHQAEEESKGQGLNESPITISEKTGLQEKQISHDDNYHIEEQLLKGLK